MVSGVASGISLSRETKAGPLEPLDSLEPVEPLPRTEVRSPPFVVTGMESMAFVDGKNLSRARLDGA